MRRFMRVVGVVVAASAAGCSFHGRDLGPGDDTGDDVGAADAEPGAPDAVPTTDDDHDGIDDAVDNCLGRANPDQANEDGDPDGDACDRCPQLAAPQNDTDGDNVGDGCDPHPTTGGDELILFDGFAGDALAPEWAVSQLGGSGSWTVNGGALAVTVGEPAGIAVRPVGNPGDTLVVDAAIDVTAVGPDVTRSVALLADAEAGAAAFDFCAVSFDAAEIELYRYENTEWTSIEAVPISTPLGNYTLRSRTMSGVACTVSGTEVPIQAAAGTGDHVGVRVRNATVRFAYIAVYRTP